MKFGLCKGSEHAMDMEKLGFDYLEGHLTSLALASPGELREHKQNLENTSLRYEACNCFFPKEVRLTGEDMDLTTVRDYVKRAFEHAKPLGLQIAVLGSGGARNVPEGFPMEKAWEQLREVFFAAGEIAKNYGITIALEPLRSKECNILNHVAQGDTIAVEVGHPNIRVLADIYHMYCDNEPYSNIPVMQTRLAHVHFCDPTARRYPKLTDTYDYTDFAENLKAAQYDARVSIEAGCDDLLRDAADALAVMRHWFA